LNCCLLDWRVANARVAIAMIGLGNSYFNQCSKAVCTSMGYLVAKSCASMGYLVAKSCVCMGYLVAKSCVRMGYLVAKSCVCMGYLVAKSCASMGYLVAKSCASMGYLEAKSCVRGVAHTKLVSRFHGTLEGVSGTPHNTR